MVPLFWKLYQSRPPCHMTDWIVIQVSCVSGKTRTKTHHTSWGPCTLWASHGLLWLARSTTGHSRNIKQQLSFKEVFVCCYRALMRHVWKTDTQDNWQPGPKSKINPTSSCSTSLFSMELLHCHCRSSFKSAAHLLFHPLQQEVVFTWDVKIWSSIAGSPVVNQLVVSHHFSSS